MSHPSFIQFPPMSDKIMAPTRAESHVTQEQFHNTQDIRRTAMAQPMLFVKPKERNQFGNHPENKSDVMVVSHQVVQF
jgi:hypothetical protein